MKISKQACRNAKELFRTSLVEGRIDEGRVRQIVQQVIARKPRGYLAILGHFQRLVSLELARRTANVESAVPLSPDLKSSVQQNLSRVYGPGLDISFTENSALIGGMRVQVGSDVYDGTVQSRLTRLQDNF